MYIPVTKDYRMLTHQQFDQLVQEKLGIKGYQSLAYEDWSLGSSNVLSISLNTYTIADQDEVWDVLEGEREDEEEMCDAHLLLLELASRQEIPEGDYIITVPVQLGDGEKKEEYL